MAVPPSDRVRRTTVALLLATLLMVLAGCSGDDDGKGEGPTAEEIIRGLPNAAEVESLVTGAVDTSEVPDDLVPGQGLIARYGSLTGLEQRCARDYGTAAVDELCILGDPQSEKTFALWGDSRAAMWMPALSRIAEQTGYRLVVFTKLGCPPLSGVTPWLEAESRANTECATYNESVTRILDEIVKPEIVVMTGAVRNFSVADDGEPRSLGEVGADNTWTPDADRDEIWQQGLDRALASLDDNDAEVFVLGEPPYPPHDAGTCLAEHEDDIGECAVTPDEGVYAEHDAAVKKTAERNGATYVSPLPWLCSGDVCPAVVDEHVVYRDSFHLNREYVLHISRALGSALGLDDWKALEQ